MMSNKFSIIEVSEKQIAGITVPTDIKKAHQDCPTLWKSFESKVIHQLPGTAIAPNADTYGVSCMIDEQRFIYWAAIKVNSTDNLPADMQTMLIPAGLYVCYQATSLEKLSEAYTALFMEWPQSQNDYALDMNGISFELYKHGWQMHSPLEIYAAVIKKRHLHNVYD